VLDDGNEGNSSSIWSHFILIYGDVTLAFIGQYKMNNVFNYDPHN